MNSTNLFKHKMDQKLKEIENESLNINSLNNQSTIATPTNEENTVENKDIADGHNSIFNF